MLSDVTFDENDKFFVCEKMILSMNKRFFP